jgi:2-phospho-L-lactate guanylyltransferase (CobY/MobA/RfbA family)
VDCTVVIMDALSALKLQHLTNCTVLVGAVAGSVLARSCKGCTMHLVARQLRIHDSVDTTW